MKEFLNERKHLSKQQRIQVLVAGRTIAPKIYSIKEVKIEQCPFQTVIPVAVRRGAASKFKIPFKNLVNCIYHDSRQDIDVEFQFLQTSAAFNFKDSDNQVQTL